MKSSVLKTAARTRSGSDLFLSLSFMCFLFFVGLANRGFQIVPIIEIPGYGQISAKLMCEKLDIKSCKEADKLKKAKDEVWFLFLVGWLFAQNTSYLKIIA